MFEDLISELEATSILPADLCARVTHALRTKDTVDFDLVSRLGDVLGVCPVLTRMHGTPRWLCRLEPPKRENHATGLNAVLHHFGLLLDGIEDLDGYGYRCDDDDGVLYIRQSVAQALEPSPSRIEAFVTTVCALHAWLLEGVRYWPPAVREAVLRYEMEIGARKIRAAYDAAELADEGIIPDPFTLSERVAVCRTVLAAHGIEARSYERPNRSAGAA